LKTFDTPFRLIFADPPYARQASDRNYAVELLASKELRVAVEPEGILVVERSPVKKEADSSIWKVTRAKKYGKTEVVFCVVKS
jgi:16S rRNA G966 N2-methylase RsmD